MNDSFTNDAKIALRIGAATVGLHPADAAERGLAEGDLAALTNDTGRLELRVTLRATCLGASRCPARAAGRSAKRAAQTLTPSNPGEHTDMGRSTAVHRIEVTITPARHTPRTSSTSLPNVH
jgi:anaerobic selenocysteine-containing dehydrogenase